MIGIRIQMTTSIIKKFNESIQKTSNNTNGFTYTCIELKKLIHQNYYKQSLGQSVTNRLGPPDLAKEMVDAYQSLYNIIPLSNHLNSVFFGKSSTKQTIMQDSFFAAVMHVLLIFGANNVPQGSWTNLFRILDFHRSNWQFYWINSLHGRNGTNSRNIAMEVLKHYFEKGQLPTMFSPSGKVNISLPDYLRGRGAVCKFQYAKPSSSGRFPKKGVQNCDIFAGGHMTINISPSTMIRIKRKSINQIKNPKIYDSTAPPSRPKLYPAVTKGGLILNPNNHSNPLEITVVMEHYGNVKTDVNVEINW